MQRELIIGDLHGGLRALTQVMERANVTTDDTLIFLGDYVDGWSDAAQLIDHLVKLDDTHNCIFIKGNHDTWCHQWLLSGLRDESWLAHGGLATIESYSNYSEAEKKEHLIFFDKLEYFKTDDAGRLFIHAGFTSLHGPQYQADREQCTKDRTLWELAMATDINLPTNSYRYPRRLKLYKEIYIGHTPTINFDEDKPMNGANVWNVDTGAAFTGPLSIIDAGSKAFWQSDPVHQLYPGEKGRNKK